MKHGTGIGSKSRVYCRVHNHNQRSLTNFFGYRSWEYVGHGVAMSVLYPMNYSDRYFLCITNVGRRHTDQTMSVIAKKHFLHSIETIVGSFDPVHLPQLTEAEQ